MTRERWGGKRVMTLRAQWAPRVQTGDLPCGKCGLTIAPDAPWCLGHLRDRALGGTAADGLHPEHRHCSNSSGGQLAAALGVGVHAGRPRRPTPTAIAVPTVDRRPWR